MACFTLRDLEACVLEMSRWYIPGTLSVGTTFTSKSRLQQSLVWHYNHRQTVEGRDRETKGTCSPTEGLLPKMYVGIKAITFKWALSCGWHLMLFIMNTYCILVWVYFTSLALLYNKSTLNIYCDKIPAGLYGAEGHFHLGKPNAQKKKQVYVNVQLNKRLDSALYVTTAINKLSLKCTSCCCGAKTLYLHFPSFGRFCMNQINQALFISLCCFMDG